MSLAQTALLGAIAGFTIFLGLPLGRVRGLSERARVFLSMMSVGILVFLLVEILEHAIEPVEESLLAVRAGSGSAAEFAVMAAVFVVGFALGLVGLAVFETRVMRAGQVVDQVLSPARVALIIAVGLGLHNFAEGLAIGQSAMKGELALAGILIVGFGLHNATEGFGIVGPLANTLPTWRFLFLAGLLAGAPTMLGSIVGYQFNSEILSVLFLTLAGGSILFIIGELFNVGRKAGLKAVAMWGIVAGFVLGLGTELVLVFAGA